MSCIGKIKNKPAAFKPTIITGFNNEVLRKWFAERLEDRAKLIDDCDSGKLLQETALAYRPDIMIIMRTGEGRGLPEAAQLAVWGLDNSFKVVLIIGERDDEWEVIDNVVKDAGGYVISWGKGEERSSFYMMNIIMSIIKELVENQVSAWNGEDEDKTTAEEYIAPVETKTEMSVVIAEETAAAPESEKQETSLKESAIERVLLATGHPSVDREIKLLLSSHSMEIAGECYDRRVIFNVVQELNPGIVVVSPYLKGDGDLVTIIRAMRENGVRVVVLPGDANEAEARAMVKKLIPLGVYDFVFDQVTAPEILERLRQPARLGDIPRILSEPAITGYAMDEETQRDSAAVEPVKRWGFWTRLRKHFAWKRKLSALIFERKAIKEPYAEQTTVSSAVEPYEGMSVKRRVMIESLKTGADKLTSKLKKPQAVRIPDNENGRLPTGSINPRPTARLGYGGFMSSGAIAFVSPWRPGLAGRLAAAAAELYAVEERVKTAVIGVSGHSTIAGRLGIEDDELIMSDWRIPGSQAPVIRGNFRIWAVDPGKSLHIYNEEEMGLLIAKAQSDHQRVIIDCAGEHQLAQELLYHDVDVMFIIPGDDIVERNTALLWLNRLCSTGKPVSCGIDLRDSINPVPEGLKPELIIRDSPEEALWEKLQGNNELLVKVN